MDFKQVDNIVLVIGKTEGHIDQSLLARNILNEKNGPYLIFSISFMYSLQRFDFPIVIVVSQYCFNYFTRCTREEEHFVFFTLSC